MAAWGIALGSVAGAVAGLKGPPAVLPAAVLVLAAVVWRRRPLVALSLLVAAVSCLNGMRVAETGGELERRASAVPRCGVAATISAHTGLGTIVRIASIDCGEGSEPMEGVAVIDGAVADPGGALIGRVRLVPLGTSGFDAARRAAGIEAELDPIELVEAPPRRPLFAAAVVFRHAVQAAAHRLDARRAALLSGLTIGDTSGFDPATGSAMRRAGLSHLVAVSGSNVAMVLGAVLLLLAPLGRIAASVAAAAVLLLYVLVVGPEPSVLRAAAMGALGLTAVLVGRRSEPVAALGLAIGVVALVQPRLMTSVGLHLSVAATAGLILWSLPVATRLRLPRPLALAAGVTIAAQAGVAPLLIGVFGEISATGLVANLLAAPAVAPATILGLAAGLVQLVSEPLGGLLAVAAGPFLGWILMVGERCGSPSWAVLSLPGWSAWPLGLALTVLAVRTLSARPAVTLEP
jgi:competence protein ComEC